MTLDEAVKVLDRWDRKHKCGRTERWSIVNATNNSHSLALWNPKEDDEWKWFWNLRPDTVILSAARWAKKRMEGKR